MLTLSTMSEDEGRLPIPGVGGKEAAEILGVRSAMDVYRLVSAGVLPKTLKYATFALDRAEVERVAPDRYRPNHPYWLSTKEAPLLLGVTQNRVRQRVHRGSCRRW